ncbi:hypothetical protein ACQEVY_30600 [Streptomyces sp. CA-288835]|uniref:hypothetical protein n=1 Tax=Streptomyces sp. CA-288835 TaxID=3240069 RepID=UPI003D8E6927
MEDIDGVLLVRSVEDDSFPLDALAEVAHAVSAEADEGGERGAEGIVTVIVGAAAGGGPPDADHWARLGALLDSLRSQGTGRVRLVMSGAGDDRPGRPCVARRIADAWELEVIAPDGAVLITPGGALFVHGDSGPGCGWWRFAPGEAPRKLGARAPAPVWQEALGRVPSRTKGGCVVDPIPAGVLIRPAEAPGPGPGDLCFAVPVDFERPMVLVGAPQAEDVAADEVAAVLAALPVALRSRVRLVPGGRRDLLRLGQSVADMLGADVEILTGLPLLADHAPPGAAPRPTLVGRDGKPSWRPFVSSVVCGPADAEGRAPALRPVGSHPPDWIPGGSEPGTVRLTDRWQATVTRAGLALWEQDGPRPPLAGAAVDPDVCVIELGAPGQPLDTSLLPALSRLLRGLGAETRAKSTLLVRGRLITGEGELRRLAAEHGVPGIRYVTAGPARAAARPTGSGPRPRAGAVPPPTGSGTPAARTPGAAASPERVREAEPSGALPLGGAGAAGPVHASGGALVGEGIALAAGGEEAGPGRGGRTPAGGAGTGPEGGSGGGAVAGVAGHGPGGTAAGAGTELTGGGASASPGSGGRTGTGEGPYGADGGEPESSGPETHAQLRSPRPELARLPERRASKARAPEAEAPEARGSETQGPEVRGPEARVPKAPAAEAGAPDVPVPEAQAPEALSPATNAPDVRPSGARVQEARAPEVGSPAVRAREARPPEGRVSKTRASEAPAPEMRASEARAPEARLPRTRVVEARAPEAEAPEAGAPVAPAPEASAVPLPFVPGHVSGAAERVAFRDFASGVWEGHAAAVSRVLTRMPALRGRELEAARVDLIAAHAYLTTEEGVLHHRELTRDLRTGEGRLLPYAGCLASGLRRLPSYRGVALRGGDAAGPEPAIGALVQEPASVSALAGASGLPTGAAVRYAIWSVTGRKVRQLLDRPAGSPEAYEEVVFVPGTGFRALGVRTGPGGSPVVLLRELPGNSTAYMDGAEELSSLDLKALAHLEEALSKGFPAGEGRSWPERCTGSVGHGG